MNSLIHPVVQVWVELLGWTIVHSLWQITLIAALFAIAAGVLNAIFENGGTNSARQKLKYTASMVALAAMLVAPVVTFVFLSQRATDELEVVAKPFLMNVGPTPTEHLSRVRTAGTRAEDFRPGFKDATESAIVAIEAADKKSKLATKSIEKESANWIVVSLAIAWLLGVCLVLIRPILGLNRIRQLLHSATDLPELEIVVQRIAKSLGIPFAVKCVGTALSDVPIVIGHLRPIILVPMSFVSNVDVWQLECVLAHELAHVHRRDYLFNIVQVVIETILFFHPAMWWVSQRAREYREYCADDLALSICPSGEAYIEALLKLERRRTQPIPAIAANGSPLLARVRRIERILAPVPRQSKFGRTTFAIIVGLGALTVLATVLYTGQPNQTTSSFAAVRAGGNKEQPTMANEFSATPAGICEAARAGDLSAIERILTEKPELIAIDNPHNWTKTVEGHDISGSFNKKPVEVAAFFNQAAAVKKLLETSRDSSVISDPSDNSISGYFNSLRYFNSLSIAMVMGHDDVIKAIEIDVLARVDGRPELLRDTGERKDTLLLYAARQGHMPLVRMLLERGADVNPVAANGHTVIQTVLDGSKNQERRAIARLLVERGAHVTLWVATAMEDVDRIKALLAEDPELAKEKWPWSQCCPLVRACLLGNRPIIELLLDHGADINADIGDETPCDFGMPLMNVYYAGRYDLVNLLLDRGASVHAHPNCDTPFIDLVYRDALKSNPVAVNRGKPSGDTDEAVTLYWRVASLEGEPHIYSHVEAKNYGEIERLLREKPLAEAHNYGRGPGTVLTSLCHAAAWLGDAKAMELCLKLQPKLLTPELVNENLRDAVRSHNREGSFADYRRIIEMNLKFLKEQNAPLTIEPLWLLATEFLQNNRYS